MTLATICGGKIVDKLRCKRHKKMLCLLFEREKNDMKITHFTYNTSDTRPTNVLLWNVL